MLGAAIIVVGLVVFASFGDPAAGVDNAPGSDWARRDPGHRRGCAALLLFADRGGLVKAALLGTVAGMLYGLSATLMKPVVESHAHRRVGEVVGLGALGHGCRRQCWLRVQQLSLSTGRLVPSVAAVSVVNPIVSVLLGALVLQERLDKDPPWHAVVAVGGLCFALVGAVVISSAREGSKKEVEETASEPRAALV